MILIQQFRAYWLVASFGFILFVAGSGLLFWNEGRAVHKTLALDEALNDGVSLMAEIPIESTYEGRLVHIVGSLVTEEPLTEPDYGIQVNSVKLKRRVQMYQWIEETMEHRYGESIASVETEDRTYYYTMDWRDHLIDSRNFYIRTGHHNPRAFPLESRVQVAERVQIGYYELGVAVKDRISSFVELTSDSRPEDPAVKLHSGLYYHCNDVWNPEIGDIRIQFAFAGLEGETYTVVGRLSQGVLVPYQTSLGSHVLLVFKGEHSLTDAFKQEHKSQRMTTWTIRFFGWLLLFFAATATASIVHVALAHNCYLSRIAPDPAHPVSANLILSFSLALLITSLAWAFHRPWVGAGLLLAAASPFLCCARGVVQYQRLN
ncbi:transmembrane protein 43 homolog [Phlebotomus argentipes]|uniref:transmembrane protein 43 homolog n=1 Tax=Phlebotomus argentipes TaxID=94469 RepID=UPI0028934EFC|nr:transmembrane protein 43 homolog [Phlebotomus argentipes]